MYEIKVESYFSAAHNLRGYKGKCEALHGHNWKVEVEVASRKLNRQGLVLDFQELKDKLNKITARFDHRHLNEIPFFKKANPTSENIAKYIFDALKKQCLPLKIKRVTVWESNNSAASFTA